MKSFLAGIIFLLITTSLFAKDPYPVNPNLDILHYSFELKVFENNDSLIGKASISCRIFSPEKQAAFDLVSEKNGSGMTVHSVTDESSPLKFTHKNNRIIVNIPQYSCKDTLITIQIEYAGIPADGLIISKNKYGKNSYFGDNWPDRARNWLPCVDHPSDKATVDFIVHAPEEYEVVGVGYRKACYPAGDHYNTTKYSSSVPLPTKVMVVGIADFAMQTSGFVGQTPIETWVYVEDKDKGFIDYAPAAEIVDFYSHRIGPFAFEKLANVQSKTVYGGMENSGAIFYSENSVSGKNRAVGLMAHEIAHQWFGDAVTERDWHHIWLSEGFATYMETVYTTEHSADITLADRMTSLRKRVISYYKRNPSPVVDTTIVNLRRLLSTNSYQKGAWFLHMLRHELGEVTFWKGMSAYYKKFKNKNALTDDFRRVMEEVSGKNLESFFYQWLYQAGHPVLKLKYNYDTNSETASIEISQKQDAPFSFKLDLLFQSKDGQKSEQQTFSINNKKSVIKTPLSFEPGKIIMDPNCWLLFNNASTQ